MSSTLLITGGAGFIGAHLARHWIESGGSALVLDDFSTGSLEALAGIDARTRLRIVEGSVLDVQRVRDLVAECDAVAHLAAVVGVLRVVQDPERTLRVNGEGSRIVLEAAAERGLKVLLASSSEVYGASRAVPFVEAQPLSVAARGARASYAAAKLYAEKLALELCARNKLRPLIVRFFNTTGPGQGERSGMVLPRFCAAALKGSPLSLHGDGSQTRTFAHVADVVAVCAALLENDAALGGIYNVGSDEEISIRALAERVISSAGSMSTCECVPYARVFGPEFEDPPRRVPALQAVRAALGRVPGRPLDALIADTLEWQRATLVEQRG